MRSGIASQEAFHTPDSRTPRLQPRIRSNVAVGPAPRLNTGGARARRRIQAWIYTSQDKLTETCGHQG
ncbi:MAG: hypothetical protein JJ992_10590, partial [Planctomycetes bacterium]|nr:hypothetical protein [Planctomycetota bacterium]